MTGLRGRASIAGCALIITAGLALPFATASIAPAATSPQAPGTDVSNLTTVTSWPDVAATGAAFVGIEAIQGKTIPNTQYNAQVTGATSAGLFVMPYVFADPGKIADGGTQWGYAWNVINAVPGVPYARGGQMLPVVLDMESDPLNFPGQPCYGLTQAAMVTWIGQFLNAAKAQTGAVPLIYTNPNWWASCTGNNATAFAGYPLWIANYGVSSPAIPPGWTGYTFWQSSSSGSINGISGSADLDQMQGAPPTVVAKSGSVGSLQVQSLNSLAGQQVSYTATGLAAGLSMSSSGLFSWVPGTAVGAYPVTVTPTESGVLPSTVSFTLKVHGSITITVGNRISTAGTPIALRVSTSGPDQAAGFAPSFRVTGLPTGLSMDSAGLITGWPSRPGTFKFTLSASDGLGGTGSASFTWTIKAAGDSGFGGAIRQAGGTGKCLDDPGSRTANGTIVDLWGCTGHANQNWTVVPDGTVRVLGKCLDAVGESRTNGAKLQLWTCNSGDGGQQWQAGTDGELVNPQSGKCLDDPVSSAANGQKPVLWTCANLASQPNEHWLRPAASIYSGNPGKCMAVSGSAVVLAGCANTGAQHWTAQPDGTVRLGGKCLTEAAATPRSGLVVGSCSGAAATKWKLVAAGPIATELAGAAPGLCATTSSAANGAGLVIESCAATPAATWHVE